MIRFGVYITGAEMVEPSYSPEELCSQRITENQLHFFAFIFICGVVCGSVRVWCKSSSLSKGVNLKPLPCTVRLIPGESS